MSLLLSQRSNLSENSFEKYSLEISLVLLFVRLNHDLNTCTHASVHERSNFFAKDIQIRVKESRLEASELNLYHRTFCDKNKDLREIFLQIINNISVENFLYISAANFVERRVQRCYLLYFNRIAIRIKGFSKNWT